MPHLDDILRELAFPGGFLARKSYRESGVKTIWQGVDKRPPCRVLTPTRISTKEESTLKTVRYQQGIVAHHEKYYIEIISFQESP
ncbi:MAG: hypothetical protein GZ090_02585 [Oxalobacteraceae bacterium]|nr:hypothetical protein [Oxalobacteraceae bacterium]